MFFLEKGESRDKIYGKLEKLALIAKVIWFEWLINWIWGLFSSNYLKWLLHCKLGRFIKFLKLDLMRLIVALYESLEDNLRWIEYMV